MSDSIIIGRFSGNNLSTVLTRSKKIDEKKIFERQGVHLNVVNFQLENAGGLNKLTLSFF